MNARSAATAITFIALLNGIIAGTAGAQNAPPPALPVTVAQPLAKRITNWDEYWGRFEAVERVEVRPRVSGFIEQVHFKDGTLVKAGDLLFTIDKRPFLIAVDIAKADVARQEALVVLAASEVERAEPLAKSKVMSELMFDQTQGRFERRSSATSRQQGVPQID